MRRALLLALLALPLAGCAEPAAPGGGDGAVATRVEAPWWPVGAWWDIDFATADGVARRARMVHFENASEHFWLGVERRADALDHALHDTNPFLGRVHWELLAPHEGNRHAIMYRFPLQDGESYTSGNPFFGSDWRLSVERRDGRYHVEGMAPDGATIAYDYDPASGWFEHLLIREANGALRLEARVTGHGTDARGTYWFLRGRDYHEGPQVGGAHEERFEVLAEEKEVAALVLEIDAAFSGPMRIDLVDPSGALRHTETVTGGRVQRDVEVRGPHPPGTWTIRYLGAGDVEGRVHVTGILEYSATV